jgi:hypothetical protein
MSALDILQFIGLALVWALSVSGWLASAAMVFLSREPAHDDAIGEYK